MQKKEKYLYIQTGPYVEETVFEWLEDLIEDTDDGEIIHKEWEDIETFQMWLSESYYPNIIIDWYYFDRVEDFYQFMVLCKLHGATYVWCDEVGIELQRHFDSETLELLYLMCNKNEVDHENWFLRGMSI